MKKTILAALLAGTFNLAFAADAGKDADKIVARYNNTDVTASQVMAQFQEALKSQPQFSGKTFDQLDENIRKMMVTNYVNQKLLEEQVKNSGIENTQAFKDKLALAKEQVAQQMYLEKIVKESMTQDALKAEYDKMVKEMEGKQEADISHILVKTEKEAEDIKKKLKKGEKFDTLAAKYSIDEGTKKNGGNLGFVNESSLVPAFREVAFNMKKNDIQIAKTEFGYHVIILKEKRQIAIPNYQEALPSLEAALGRQTIKEFFERLAKQANVQYSV